MAKNSYQQVVEMVSKLTRDEQFELIRVITDHIRGINRSSDLPEEEETDTENRGRKNLPKIAALLEWGVIQLRETLFVEGHEDEAAMLLDKNTVAYRGQEMRINDWARQVAGWTSISIYRSVIVKRVGQTLGQIRDQYMRANGIPNSD